MPDPTSFARATPLASFGKRPKTGGRQKGTPNKKTRIVKDTILEVFGRLQTEAGGGIEHFLDWARANPTEFYRLVARLVPRPTPVPEPDPDPITEIRRFIVYPNGEKREYGQPRGPGLVEGA